jgi:RNA polymerase sigma-70 factor (ECF subfamily)
MTAIEFASIFPSLLPRVWAFALRVAGDQDHAEILAHRACNQAVEQVHQFDGGITPLYWLYSIIYESWTRDESLRPGKEVSNPQPKAIRFFTKPLHEPATMEERIVNAVQELPEVHRVLMLLIAVEGLTCIEASVVLRLPIETVLCRLSAARQTIGSKFSQHYTNVRSASA